MKKLVVVILILGAVYYFKPGWFSFGANNGAFDAEGNPETLVFTIKNCGGWCEKGLAELGRRKVPFRELKLDDNEENQQLYSKLGRGGLPYFVVGQYKLSGYLHAAVASTLAQAYGDKYLSRLERKYFARHFNDDNSPKVYMYGASWCPYCKAMRKELENRGVDYAEIDVEKAYDQDTLVKTMDIGGDPVIYVGYVRINPPKIGNVMSAINEAGYRKM